MDREIDLNYLNDDASFELFMEWVCKNPEQFDKNYPDLSKGFTLGLNSQPEIIAALFERLSSLFPIWIENANKLIGSAKIDELNHIASFLEKFENKEFTNETVELSRRKMKSLAKEYAVYVNDLIVKEVGGEIETQEKPNKGFTTARQVLALHFIFEELALANTEIDRTDKAKFAEFLTGKSFKNIYDDFQNPLITKQKQFRFKDLQFIRPYFEDLGLSKIVQAINNELEKPR